MSFTMELYTLLIRYTKDSEGLDVTIEDLYKIPWWRCVWGSWTAKAYYGMDNYYTKLEDVPAGIDTYYVIADDVRTEYFIGVGGFPVVQVMSKDMCKDVYGG